MFKNKIALPLILPLLAAGAAFASEFEVVDNLVVGSSITAGGGKFKVNASGDLVKINNVTYAWPSADGDANTYLKDVLGDGTLSWAAGGAPLTPWTENIHGAGYNLTCASVTATGIGLGAAQLRLADGVFISSEAGAAVGAGVRVSPNIYIVGFSSAAKYYGDGSSLTGLPGSDPDRVLKVGDTMTGPLVLPSDPVMDLQTATKQYVDASTATGNCPAGMAYIPGPLPYCVDQYEAYNSNSGTVGSCPCTNGSQSDVDDCVTDIVAGSASGQTPLVSINWCAAKKACLNAGKHLLTNTEWFNAANYKGGQYNITAEEHGETMGCNTTGHGAAVATGSHAGCVTQEGVYDMIGNVWEWVDFVMTVNPTNGLTDNYVTGYDFATGMPASVGASSNVYGNDYFWTYAGGGNARATLRGGVWNNNGLAGVFTVNVNPLPGSTAAEYGFRCGKPR